jgi:hypothetical protein
LPCWRSLYFLLPCAKIIGTAYFSQKNDLAQ